MNKLIRFVKDWTLPVAIAVGSTCYLVFYWIPSLDSLGDMLSPVFDLIFPLFVFLTLLVTFCKVDFHQMLPHRWHAGVLLAQLLLVAVNIGIIFLVEADVEQKILWEAVLTCIIGPSASAAPVVVGKLGGNINTMTTYTLLSSLVSALLIPLVFPILERAVHLDFMVAFLIILEKVALVLLLPLVLGWLIQHYCHALHRRIVSMPNLSFYFWAISLSITTGITVKNIVHSNASLTLLLLIALFTFVLCFVQFAIGRGIGRRLGEEINAGQALFQKNTALSIWVAYMYLNPVASVGAGCYVLWQNIINSIEIWQERRKQ
ncbi:MAG: transporter [Prevotella sp.]|nr:transporter [Prevotella sp.]MBR1505117.1 transporter [Prevotella sp.]